MRAKIKSFESVDIEDLYNFIPEKADNFSFLLELLVGPDNEEGSESFSIQVCTPLWLLSNMKKGDAIMGSHFLFVLEYDFEKILNTIKKRVEGCTGSNWNDVARKVACIGHWEFEDYME